MRVTIVRDGETSAAEVADDLESVTVAGHRFPVKVVAASGARVELEIAGERVTVDGWPDRYPKPTGPVDVDGERYAVAVELSLPESRPGGTGGGPVASAPPPAAASAPRAPDGRGTAVLPPMPGKVVELRVRDGEAVRQGQVLLVVEAMKMRNEITSPVDGTVRGLAVTAGANVRAREPMLYVEPA